MSWRPSSAPPARTGGIGAGSPGAPASPRTLSRRSRWPRSRPPRWTAARSGSWFYDLGLNDVAAAGRHIHVPHVAAAYARDVDDAGVRSGDLPAAYDEHVHVGHPPPDGAHLAHDVEPLPGEDELPRPLGDLDLPLGEVEAGSPQLGGPHHAVLPVGAGAVQELLDDDEILPREHESIPVSGRLPRPPHSSLGSGPPRLA